ncbi:MAG TPA: SUMF1/EgtB/PvdO family nonheme iron enzyme [Polyangiaceae bacterium]|nr:SUMF1/EgtB/PvdO family nonheme iron enzyme [Polyangiaceae bacterium]
MTGGCGGGPGRGALIAALVALSGALVALTARPPAPAEPSRCEPPWRPAGARCCAPGQAAGPGGECLGEPTECPPTHAPFAGGCLPREARVEFAGGLLSLRPSDWEADGAVEPRAAPVGPFALDRFEASVGRYAACVARGACPGPVPPGDPSRAALVSLEQAGALCAAEGGRLPLDDEWSWAASGPSSRRYPWGETGAVCRRAAFGLVEGPCAWGATGPDTVGARPAGATPEGLFDLAGNAPEWALGAGGRPRVRGGSFASRLAAELRSWRGAEAPGGAAGGRAGVRCAYSISSNVENAPRPDLR